MKPTRPIDSLAVAVMLVLCMSWAFQQIAVKWALPELGALAQGALRSAIATMLVGAFMLMRVSVSPWRSSANRAGLLAGFLFGAEFMLLYVSLNYTDASRAIMLLYSAPFVVAIGGHFMFASERLDSKASLGILLAFIGVIVTLNPAGGTDNETLKGDLLALAAGFGWGLTTLVIRGTDLRSAPAAQVLFYQLAVSVVMFGVAAMMAGESVVVPMSPLTVASVLYQAVWVAAITFGIWFALIARYPATGLSVITFMTPIFGALMGYAFLDEHLGWRHAFSVLAVAIGILLVTLPRNAMQPAKI